jgi:hypothetical protein
MEGWIWKEVEKIRLKKGSNKGNAEGGRKTQIIVFLEPGENNFIL